MTIVLTQQCYDHKEALYNRLVAQDDRSSGKLTLLLLFFLCKVFSSNKVAIKAVLLPQCGGTSSTHKHCLSDWWHQMAGHHPTSPKVTQHP